MVRKNELLIPNHDRSIENLRRLQRLPIKQKISLSLRRIEQFYTEMGGKIYVSLSGKDSIVLLHLAQSLYPDIQAVHVDTGVEYPGIKEYMRNVENIIILKPELSFVQVIEKHGYPAVSKKVSMGIDRYRNTQSNVQKGLRINGGINPTSGKKQYRTIPIKWQYLLSTPFKISEKCCDVLKKAPVKKFHRKTGLFPMTGEMASDSKIREEHWLKHGCNGFDLKIPKSTPLAFWTEKDIWQYIDENNISLPEPYKEGERRTGCMYCLFGCQFDDEGGAKRFERMKKNYPKHYRFAEKIGVIELLNIIKDGHYEKR